MRCDFQPKTVAWSKSKEKQAKKKKKEFKASNKRQRANDEDDNDDLASDIRLMKRLKSGKVDDFCQLSVDKHKLSVVCISFLLVVTVFDGHGRDCVTTFRQVSSTFSLRGNSIYHSLTLPSDRDPFLSQLHRRGITWRLTFDGSPPSPPSRNISRPICL